MAFTLCPTIKNNNRLMNRIPYAWGTLILLLLTACQQHFLSDTNERQ